MSAISKMCDNQHTLLKLTKAFPAELQEDVKAVLRSCLKTRVGNDVAQGISTGDERPFCLNTEEAVELPYRLYFVDDIVEHDFVNLTVTQQTIYHCLFSLSYDGYVREKHIKALLSQDHIPMWTFPFVLKNSSEYVVQILETIYQGLKDRDHVDLKYFCRRNMQAFLYDYSRMISYWNAYYRDDCYKYKDYIGRKLYIECFGYTRELEKYRETKKGDE